MGDGNKIRERIENHLLNGELESLEILSQKLIDAIDKTKLLAISIMGAKVIMAGGDDLLLLVEYTKYHRELVQQLSDLFERESGASISFGVGQTLESAYLNLRRAKSSRTSNIIEGDRSK
jgi:hypothetical protein